MCNHENIKEYYYGYVSDSFIEQSGNVFYGGFRKTADTPDYFCMDCLEDIFESI